MVRGGKLEILILAVAVGLGAFSVRAEMKAPIGNKGFKSTVLQTIDLGPEIKGMDGRELRMRVLTIEPGGYIGLHNHKDRPSVVYFLRGVDTVTFANGTSKVFHAGDTTLANKDTVHWHHNDGKEPAVLIAVDVFHKAK